MAEDDKPLTKEEREQKWWDKWWEADYSWDGLAKKEWQGWAVHPDKHQFAVRPAEEAPADWRPATLQDYWRKAGVKKKHLIECGGRQFTKFHLPFNDRDGNATEKDGWDDDEWVRFADELAPRLAEASETKGKFGRIDGPDNRAQFDGVVARALPGPPPAPDEAPQETETDKSASASPGRIHLSAENTWLSLGASCSGAAFGPFTVFTGAIFSGDAHFDNATFSGNAWFNNATFSGDARFDNATFSGYAWFNKATFSGNASFANATFSRNAWFNKATFSGNARFDNATFSGYAWFNKATFSGNAWFDNATFSGYAWFDNATFSGDAWFRSLNAARVKTLSFAGALIEKPIAVCFARRPARSTSAARAFLDVELPRLLDLSGDGVFTFFEMLDGAVTKGKVDFDEATFENDNGFKIALARACVPQLGAAPFSAKLERFVATWHWRARVFFLQALSFESRQFVFKRMEKPTLNSPYLKRLNADLAYYKKVIRARNKNLRALEGGCRTLKLAFENQRDRVNEQRFYRYELIARRHNMLTPWWERWTSHLFGAVSDYGGSITRPIGFLGGLWLTTAAIFYWLGLSVKCASPWGALTLSGEMIFRPFFVWAPRSKEANGLAGALLGDYGTGISLATKLLGTLESLIAVILLFLVALAIRRRFQIN